MTCAAQDAAPDKPKPAAPMALSPAQIGLFLDVITRLEQDFVRPVDGAEVTEQAMKGLLERVDPEGGAFYTRSEYDDFKRGLGGSRPGVGLEVRLRQGSLVVFPLDGGPAALAGIRSGDLLHTIDGIPAADLRPEAALKRLRGDAATHVVLGIARQRSSTIQQFDLERRFVDRPPVSLSRPDADLAVLRVPPFQSRTLQEVVEALNQAWARKPFKGLVLDLRDRKSVV